MQDVIDITYTGKEPFYYIRLGALLEYFQNTLMYLVKLQNESTPMLKFDYDVDSNLVYVDVLQVSVDPTICMVNRTLSIDGNPYTFAPTGEPFESPTLGPKYGQVMNIYVNMKWILTKMDELKEANTNKVVLISFLNNMLSAINSSLGGTIKLEASIDDSRNTIVIIDGNPLPNVEGVITTLNQSRANKISDKYARFDLYGYNNYGGTGSASFIKDFSLKTEITPELSTMLTVGATANSVVVGENSTAFSKFNAGLNDRFKEKIIQSTGSFATPPAANPGETEDEAAIRNLSLRFAQTFNAYKKYLKDLSLLIYNGDAETYKDALTSYTNCYQQLKQVILNNELAKKGLSPNSVPSFLPGTGFIPFNMSLTMDGLSGMKIYSKFFIDTDFLPSNYPDNAEFLIKNIEHKIENNKWFTTIDSIVISKGEADSKVLKTKANISGGGQNQSPTYKTGPITYLKTVNAKYPNVNFKDGVVPGATPSTDPINDNLLKDISMAAVAVGVVVSITTAVSGHHIVPPSRHSSGNAVDIAIIDGIAVRPSATNRAKIDSFVVALQKLGYNKNVEKGFNKSVLTFGFPNHDNHVHISQK